MSELLNISTVNAIVELSSESDDDFASQLFAVFSTQANEMAARLTLASSAQDSAEIKYLAHRLKGSAANIGAALLAEKAGRIEDLVSADAIDFPSLKSEIEALVPLQQASVAALSERLL